MFLVLLEPIFVNIVSHIENYWFRLNRKGRILCDCMTFSHTEKHSINCSVHAGFLRCVSQEYRISRKLAESALSYTHARARGPNVSGSAPVHARANLSRKGGGCAPPLRSKVGFPPTFVNLSGKHVETYINVSVFWYFWSPFSWISCHTSETIDSDRTGKLGF